MPHPAPAEPPIPVNDLRGAWLASDEAVRAAVERVLASGWYIMGPEHDAFEAELATFLGIQQAIGLASGTDALVLAMLAVGCGSGSEIVVAANAGGYASIAAAMIGTSVVYADVDPTTLLVTRATLEPALGPATRAVVLTHLYGNIADVAGITSLCRGRGIAVVEDCAQSIGGMIDGRRAGTLGDVATFSFYPTKNLGAAGDGGAIATDDPAIADRVRSLRQYGWHPRYVVAEPKGHNSRLDEIQAAILRIGLRRVDDLNERRRAIVRQYAEAITGDGIELVTGAGVPTVAHLAVVRARDRARARAAFAAAGVATDIHYPVPDHRQPGLPAPARSTILSETERAIDEIFTIPCYPSMTEAAVSRVRTVLEEVSSG
jgi:dTDP-4-amino-4,6-dideoxygalactose transaminase